MKEKVELISKVKEQFKNEWLLFDVSKLNMMNQPIKGRLVAHSPSRQALDEYWDKIEIKFPYVVWTGKISKKYAVVL